MHFIKNILTAFYAISISFSFFFIFLPKVVFCQTITASYTPWSGYWWPTNRGGLVTGIDYRGHPAPLEKYDLLTKGYYPNTVTSWYNSYYYDSSDPAWYGHCAEWSKASIYENYEIFPSSEDNIIFRVGDKKGLLTLSHLNDFIERADGSAANFHLWLLTYLQDQAVPFFADLDLTEQKWFYPIFKCDLNSFKSGNTESVTATIYYALDNVFPDYLGTKIQQRTYTYDLQLDGLGDIIGGQWTADSINDHPEVLAYPLLQQTDAPLNYDEVRAIAEAKDDFLEQADSLVPIGPGTYNLVLLDADNYSIAVQAGESFNLTIEKKQGSALALETSLENGDASWVLPGILATADVPLIRHIANSSITPYILHVSQEAYADPNIYTITLDQKKHYIQQIPYLPKNGMWTGLALTNDSEEPIDNVMLTSHDAKGVPLHTLLGPLTLAPGEKKILLSQSLPYRLHEYIKTKGLTLQADNDVQLVSLIGSGELLATQVQKNASGTHILIPETVALFSSGLSMVGSIRNEALETNVITIRSYRSDGSLAIEMSKTLTGHEILPIIPGQAPFTNLPDKGWIDVISENDKELSGFVNLTSRESLDALFGLISDETTKYIAHTPSSINWLTTVTLINPINEENTLRLHAALAGSDTSEDLTVTLAPHEKRVLSIGGEFGRLVGDPLYQSIVEINGEFEFGGYYTYQKQTGGDIASYPLLNSSDFDSKLTMPHYPGKQFWWTGVVICNPVSFAQTVLVDAYDSNGELMAGETRQIYLKPGGYEAFTISSLFGSAEKDISFVSCRTQTGNGVIGGIYLYGRNNYNTLSGSIL